MKKGLLFVVLIFVCCLLSAANDYRIETNVSVRMDGEVYAPDVVPMVDIGETILVRYDFTSEKTGNFIDKFLDSIKYMPGMIIGEFCVYSDCTPRVIQARGINYLPYGYEVDPETQINSENNFWYYTFNLVPNESGMFEIELTPSSPGDYYLYLRFYYFPNYGADSFRYSSIQDYMETSRFLDNFSWARNLDAASVNFTIKVNPDSYIVDDSIIE